jgi:hypothetical protein
MGERPDGTSLDRQKNHLGYSKKNCYWSTRLVQNNNRRNVALIQHLDKEQSLAQWCRDFGIPYPRTYDRIKRQGLSFAKAIQS